MASMTLLIESCVLARKNTRDLDVIVAKAVLSVSLFILLHSRHVLLQHDDDDDVETFRASTPSSTTYLKLSFSNMRLKTTIIALPLPSKLYETPFARKPPCSNQKNECMS
ncbi:hypothetical protein Tco_0312674 [Tanacetum coccineum]